MQNIKKKESTYKIIISKKIILLKRRLKYLKYKKEKLNSTSFDIW